MNHARRASLAMQARQFKIAEDILQQGLAIRPHDVQLHLLMAYLHQQWERYPVARQFASSAIGIAPITERGTCPLPGLLCAITNTLPTGTIPGPGLTN